MAVASNTAGVSNAVEPSPSDTSLRSLDAVNLLLAGALSGFGPYVAVFLAEQKWTQQNIGFVLTAAGFVGLLTQLPAGGLLDAVRSKRNVVALGATMVAAGALIIAFWPSFPLVLAALVLQGITGGFLGLAITSISLGLVGHAALGERLGRNQRFASTGGVLAAGLMGLIGYFLSYRAIFLATAAIPHGDLGHQAQMAGDEPMGRFAVAMLTPALGQHVFFLRFRLRMQTRYNICPTPQSTR
jgi:MFS family permease